MLAMLKIELYQCRAEIGRNQVFYFMKYPARLTVASATIESWLSGLIFSIIVGIITIGAKIIWPSLTDYGVDLGLRIAQFRSDHLTGAESSFGVDGYVFVDLDPNDISTRSYDSLCQLTRATDCQPDAALSRTALAAVVARVRSWKPRLIIVDVDMGVTLSRAQFEQVVPASVGSGAPVVGLAPYRLSGIGSAMSATPIIPWALPAQLRSAVASGRLVLAPASPSPEPVIRRYPACYRSSAGLPVKPLLPMAAASRLRGVSEAGACVPFQNNNAPRIIYTMTSAMVAPLDQFSVSPLYRRCLANNMWASDMSCGLASTFRNRVVVIGSSNADRGDVHMTPLGPMAGPEIVLNAVRSFLLHARPHTETISESIIGNFWDAAVVSAFWLPYWAVFHWWRLKKRQESHYHYGKIAIIMAGCIVFVLTFVVSFFANFSNFSPKPNADVFIPVIAQALEFFHICASIFIAWLERSVTGPLALVLVRLARRFVRGK